MRATKDTKKSATKTPKHTKRFLESHPNFVLFVLFVLFVIFVA
jgi:hypothetical protein